MGADNCQVSLSWMRVIQGFILLNRKIQNVLLSSCCGTGVFPDMLAFQSMFLYSKDRGRHKEWTAASEAILTGRRCLITQIIIKTSCAILVQASKSQYPRARLYT
jgi:hypothetical protein